MLPRGTKSCIDDTFYSLKSRQNLFSFKDILLNGYHVKTTNVGSDYGAPFLGKGPGKDPWCQEC